MVWGSFLIAAAALKTPTRNGYNAQGVNLIFFSFPLAGQRALQGGVRMDPLKRSLSPYRCAFRFDYRLTPSLCRCAFRVSSFLLVGQRALQGGQVPGGHRNVFGGDAAQPQGPRELHHLYIYVYIYI